MDIEVGDTWIELTVGTPFDPPEFEFDAPPLHAVHAQSATKVAKTDRVLITSPIPNLNEKLFRGEPTDSREVFLGKLPQRHTLHYLSNGFYRFRYRLGPGVALALPFRDSQCQIRVGHGPTPVAQLLRSSWDGYGFAG